MFFKWDKIKSFRQKWVCYPLKEKLKKNVQDPRRKAYNGRTDSEQKLVSMWVNIKKILIVQINNCV